MQIPVYLEDGETIETVGVNKTERLVHAIDAHSWVKMGTHVLMRKTEVVEGKKHNLTYGVRPKTQKDKENEKKEAEKALEDAKKALEDATKALDEKTEEDKEDDKKSGRKPAVRASK